MSHEKKKFAKIVEELTTFFFSIGASNCESKIWFEANKAYISFKSDYDINLEHKLASMKRLLNCKQKNAIDDTYWELAGTGDLGESTELLLVGMMVDNAKINVISDRVEILLVKEFSNFDK